MMASRTDVHPLEGAAVDFASARTAPEGFSEAWRQAMTHRPATANTKAARPRMIIECSPNGMLNPERKKSCLILKFELLSDFAFHGSSIYQVGCHNIFDRQTERLEDRHIAW